MGEDTITIPTWYYQHHDADFARDVPEENFGGWQRTPLDHARHHTALVVMHAWDIGSYEDYPGWWRFVPYIARANRICAEVFPPLLAAVRRSDWPVFHVVGGGGYYEDRPGYKHAVKLAGPAPERPARVDREPIREALDAFRHAQVSPGTHNAEDIERGRPHMTFPTEAEPRDDEGIAENGHQLFALCQERGINHLIYTGFAINWCLLLSPGGMHDMNARGLLCSAIRQATTAVENKESAREEWCKELALWRTALAFGFVFDTDDVIEALSS
jgi:nicotinamidase-related amidase